MPNAHQHGSPGCILQPRRTAGELAQLLLVISVAHVVVDAFAFIVQPLWPDLQQRLDVGDGSIQWAFVLWSLATSLAQLPLGYWGDRYRGRWMIWAGPALGIVCISAIGWAESFAGLVALLVLGGLGIAAFHPEAATMAGACSPHNRSRAMSLFALGGFLGQAAGPVYSGVLTEHFGARSLIWSIAWGLPALALVAAILRRTPAAQTFDTPDRVDLPTLLAGKWAAIALLLFTGALRVVPALGVPMALAYTITQRGGSNVEVGVAQSVFLAAIGAGGLGCAMAVRQTNERLLLWLLPLAAVPWLAVCPLVGGAWLLTCVALSGLAVGMTTPVLVSYGQHLLPEGQRVANSITMGVTWAGGSAIVAAVMAVFNRLGRPSGSFIAVAAASLLAGLVCLGLPRAHPGPPHAPST